MKFGPVPLEEAEGRILAHNIHADDGRRAFRKGRRLTAEDVAHLRALGRRRVYVAELEPEDVDEDTAARRLAEAAMGSGLSLSGPATGRANLRAANLGVLRLDLERLPAINALEGLTIATLLNHSAVRPRQMVATVKVIPFAVPERVLRRAEGLARQGGPLLRVDPIPSQPVGLILSGSPATRTRLLEAFRPLVERIEALGCELAQVDFVPVEEEVAEGALAEALKRQRGQGMALIVLAGETAIMDRHDIAPRAVEQAGGRVEAVGAPVDPGNLLMLAYLDAVPVLGAPGCARSPKVNVVDWILPRLLAGERLTRQDLLAWGHGGLLEDVLERPMPRARVDFGEA